MLKVVLYQPEIPPNTGNIIRLCANSGCSLHLIEPLGFTLEDKRLRRAGLDYREFARVRRYPDLDSFRAQHRETRLFALTTRGSLGYHDVSYRAGDGLLFGPETRGLPEDVLQSLGSKHYFGQEFLVQAEYLHARRQRNVVRPIAMHREDHEDLVAEFGDDQWQ